MMIFGVLAIDLIGLLFSGLELVAGAVYVFVGGIGVITALFA